MPCIGHFIFITRVNYGKCYNKLPLKEPVRALGHMFLNLGTIGVAVTHSYRSIVAVNRPTK